MMSLISGKEVLNDFRFQSRREKNEKRTAGSCQERWESAGPTEDPGAETTGKTEEKDWKKQHEEKWTGASTHSEDLLQQKGEKRLEYNADVTNFATITEQMFIIVLLFSIKWYKQQVLEEQHWQELERNLEQQIHGALQQSKKNSAGQNHRPHD